MSNSHQRWQPWKFVIWKNSILNFKFRFTESTGRVRNCLTVTSRVTDIWLTASTKTLNYSKQFWEYRIYSRFSHLLKKKNHFINIKIRGCEKTTSPSISVIFLFVVPNFVVSQYFFHLRQILFQYLLNIIFCNAECFKFNNLLQQFFLNKFYKFSIDLM